MTRARSSRKSFALLFTLIQMSATRTSEEGKGQFAFNLKLLKREELRANKERRQASKKIGISVWRSSFNK